MTATQEIPPCQAAGGYPDPVTAALLRANELIEVFVEKRPGVKNYAIRNSVLHGAPYSHRSMHAHYFLNGDT